MFHCSHLNKGTFVALLPNYCYLRCSFVAAKICLESRSLGSVQCFSVELSADGPQDIQAFWMSRMHTAVSESLKTFLSLQ